MCYKNRKKQILSYRCDVNMDERAKININLILKMMM